MHGHAHALHRASSFADFGQHINGGYQQYNHRHSVSQGAAHEYHGQVVHEQQQQHPGAQMLHRTASMPQHSYYVTEHANPGVATMNTNPMPAAYQVPRQQVERLPLEIPYTAAGITGSLQSSPSTFSPASGRSPSVHQEAFYTHQPPQSAAYAMHHTSPVEQQHPQHQMVQYAQQMPQQIQPPPQTVPSQAPPAQPIHHVQEQYQPPPPQQQQQQEEHWYSGVPYQAPVEVATIGSIPAYSTAGVYDPWSIKPEFDDPSMQLPSARLEAM